MYRFQQWKNDVEEDARITAAVDAGGFLQFDRDRSHIAPVEHDGEWQLKSNLNHNHSEHRFIEMHFLKKRYSWQNGSRNHQSKHNKPLYRSSRLVVPALNDISGHGTADDQTDDGTYGKDAAVFECRQQLKIVFH